MDTKAAILALITAWGVGACATLPAMAQDVEAASESTEVDADSDNLLLNKVWMKDSDPSDFPGGKYIFLADGTMVSDSCWETYRLSQWQQVSDTEISWDEDGMTIAADITTLSDDELVLNLKLIDGDREVRLSPAQVPFLCPDIPK